MKPLLPSPLKSATFDRTAVPTRSGEGGASLSSTHAAPAPAIPPSSTDASGRASIPTAAPTSSDASGRAPLGEGALREEGALGGGAAGGGVGRPQVTSSPEKGEVLGGSGEGSTAGTAKPETAGMAQSPQVRLPGVRRAILSMLYTYMSNTVDAVYVYEQYSRCCIRI